MTASVLYLLGSLIEAGLDVAYHLAIIAALLFVAGVLSVEFQSAARRVRSWR